MACRKSASPSAPPQLLYACLPDQHKVTISELSTSPAAAPLATIKETPADLPVSVGIDAEKEVFVANQNANIKVYAGQNYHYQMVREIEGPHTKFQHINGMAVDQSGDLYVADAGQGPGDAKILVFTGDQSGNIMPDHSIQGPHTGLTSPTGISIDATGRAFVADHDSGKILIFDANAHGDAPPIATIDSVAAPDRVFVDQDLDLYADSSSNHAITMFIPEGPNWSQAKTITAPELYDPQGIAVDASGRVAVAIPGAIAFFAADARGPSAPVELFKELSPFNPAGILIR
ncbi:MAG TPA: hypothetical protein VMF50_03050 [Candidatus Binataceae bacterium]|nr:hypothetical protein [Candidatus Binataceae bacterium]